MNKKGWGWVIGKKAPVKIDQWEKHILMQRVKAEIEKTSRIKDTVSRINIKAGRVYLYRLFEPQITEGVSFLKPLIDGKYLEIPLARITIYDKARKDCSLDWQRHNDQWMTVDEGTLEECIRKADESHWFAV